MKKNPEKTTEKNPAPVPVLNDQAAADPEVLTDMEYHIYSLVNDYINTLEDPEKIYNNNGLFIDMLKYIYRYYIQFILHNNNTDKHIYNYNILNDLFNIYTHLVYNYKKNNQPYINEYCIFINIDRTILYRIREGDVLKATEADIRNVKRWFAECEQAQLNGSGVAEIFKLKSIYRYNDNLAPLPVEYQTTGLSVAELPKLGQKGSENLLIDQKKESANDHKKP